MTTTVTVCVLASTKVMISQKLFDVVMPHIAPILQ